PFCRLRRSFTPALCTATFGLQYHPCKVPRRGCWISPFCPGRSQACKLFNTPFGFHDSLFPFVGAYTSKLSEELVLRDLDIGSARPMGQQPQYPEGRRPEHVDEDSEAFHDLEEFVGAGA